MAYTLKTTGIATSLISCIGVDEDGTTFKDFVSGVVASQDAGVAPPKIGAATWKGASRNWFKTDYYINLSDTRGISWSTPPAAFDALTGLTFFCAANTITPKDRPFWLCDDSDNTGARIDGTGHLIARSSASNRGTATTGITTGTKLSVGMHMQRYGTGLKFFYGAESGSLAVDGTYNDGSYFGGHTLNYFGGKPTKGSTPGEYFLAAWFSGLLPDADMQSLHDDWVGTLFNSGAAPDFPYQLRTIQRLF